MEYHSLINDESYTVEVCRVSWPPRSMLLVVKSRWGGEGAVTLSKREVLDLAGDLIDVAETIDGTVADTALVAAPTPDSVDQPYRLFGSIHGGPVLIVYGENDTPVLLVADLEREDDFGKGEMILERLNQAYANGYWNGHKPAGHPSQPS